jgi:hypothetical protein
MEETLPASWISDGMIKNQLKLVAEVKKRMFMVEGEINSSNKTIVIDPVPVRLWDLLWGAIKVTKFQKFPLIQEVNIFTFSRRHSKFRQYFYKVGAFQ